MVVPNRVEESRGVRMELSAAADPGEMKRLSISTLQVRSERLHHGG
jgi:hypothetical protein